MFREMTHVLGAPPDWDADAHGECLGLPIAFDASGPTITSCWELDAEDLTALADGGRVYITVWGTTQPPIGLTVRAKE
jgi:hypothetical protein